VTLVTAWRVPALRRLERFDVHEPV
jgi:hypothetical protein